MKGTRGTRAAAASVLVALGTALALAGVWSSAVATHQPADKMAVAASALEIMSNQMSLDGGPAGALGLPLGDPVAQGTSEVHELLRGTIKTSAPTDLVFRLTMECALWTDITTVGNTTSEAVATVKAWVELDGNVVPVSGDDTAEPGKVVFCNRAFRMTTLNFTNNETIETYLRTRSANAFHWMALNAGAATHEVVVKAQLETDTTGNAAAKAAVGKRTLIVEPVKLATHASV